VLPSLLKRLPVLERFLNLFHGVYYLRSIAFFALWLALLAMLLRGVEPAFLEASVLAAVLGLFMVLGLVDRFRHRFFFDRVREGGTHWRALVLQVAKWPHLVQAIGEALMSRRTGYAITWKAENGHAPRALTKPQLLVAAVTAVAAVAGTLLQGPLPRDLYALAGSVVLVSVLLVWTESWKSSAPFDARLLERRRRELGFPIDDLRGAPVVERRSAERRQGPSALPVHATIPERRQGERRGRTESLNSAGRRHPHPRRGSRDARAAG